MNSDLRVAELTEKLRSEREYHKTEMALCEKEKEMWKTDYTNLMQASRAVGMEFAIISQLKRQVNTLSEIIAWYQGHYSKWGHFYSEWEEKKKQFFKEYEDKKKSP